MGECGRSVCIHFSMHGSPLAWHTLSPWRWRQGVPPKRRWTSIELHGVASQNIVLFIDTTMSTTNAWDKCDVFMLSRVFAPVLQLAKYVTISRKKYFAEWNMYFTVVCGKRELWLWIFSRTCEVLGIADVNNTQRNITVMESTSVVSCTYMPSCAAV
jgi:hypothetical protein